MSLEADPTELEYDEAKRRWRFKPRAFHIIWSDTKQYWTMPEKGTEDPAELLNVCWLQIDGSTPQPLSKGKRYALSFRISMKDHNRGWGNVPLYMLAKVGKRGIANWAKVNVADLTTEDKTEVPEGKLRFEVPKYATDTKLYFGLYEVWSGDWKGGLEIHEAIVEEMPD